MKFKIFISIYFFIILQGCSLLKGQHGIQIKGGCLPFNLNFSVKSPLSEDNTFFSGCLTKIFSFFYNEKEIAKEDFENIDEYIKACVLSAKKYNKNLENYNKDLTTEISKLDNAFKYYLYQKDGKRKRGYFRALNITQALIDDASDISKKTEKKILDQKNILEKEKLKNENIMALYNQIKRMEENKDHLNKLINILKVIKGQDII